MKWITKLPSMTQCLAILRREYTFSKVSVSRQQVKKCQIISSTNRISLIRVRLYMRLMSSDILQPNAMLSTRVRTVSLYLQEEIEHYIRHCYQPHHHLEHQKGPHLCVENVSRRDCKIQRMTYIGLVRWSLAVVPSPTCDMLFQVDCVIMVDYSFEASLSAAREVALRD